VPKLVLLRHGESQWNLENKFTGWVDVPLSSKGEKEAHEAGRKLKSIPFNCAYTSLLKRAIDTLNIAMKETGQTSIPVIRDQALNERHYGDLQGLDKAETAEKFGADQVKLWRRSYDIAPPGGESLKDTKARSWPYYQKEIAPKVKEGQNVLVAAHGNSLRSIVMELDHLDEKQILELEIPTGVPLVYDFDDKGKIVSKKYL